ncbi:hypothetical protein VHEMI04509 [[Torrubiella] hemipterigena]|uniref:Uncharacterized protein n=1 Tax=[Torrubiella] hemipterigena TaxID=1531966 RepID=A0A0A1SVH1_9HYPO|nr:hypothetical protein VHEMI04509 [[Torrubiella] hemipterigena]
MSDPVPSVAMPEADDAFQRGLFTRLANDPEFSVADAVASFVKFEAEETNFLTHSQNHILPWKTFYALAQVAKETSASDKLDKLVGFVMELETIEVLNPETGKLVMHENGRVWNDLPYFGWTFGDELNTGIRGFDEKVVPPETLKRMENLVIYTARLSNATDVPYSHPTAPNTDFTGWSMHDFRNAFNEPEQRFEEKKMATRCWCLWLIHAGERMLTNCQHAPCWPSLSVDEITQEAWEIWRSKTKTARDVFDEDTTRLVDEALRSMRAAEDKHGGPYSIKDAKSS